MPTPPTPQPDAPVPLCVDLDGTLIKSDMLWETLVRLLKKNPLYFFPVLAWWTRGRARLKQEMARRVTVDGAAQPYHEPFLAWLREEKKSGRRILLVTASDLKMAQPAAAHVGVFEEILASDGKTNLRHEAKRRALVEKFGEHGFDYAGNSRDDLAVWRSAREAIVVNASPALVERAGRVTQVGQVFPGDSAKGAAAVRSLRPHQWVKNLILFVPALAGHKLGDAAVLAQGALAFLAFCLCASAVYVTNDLMDLDSDRRHPAKKSRPFASGTLPLPMGMLLAPLVLAAGLAVAAAVSRDFLAVTLLYVVLATSYSWWLKRVMLLDVFWLAGLYTTRLIAGGAATHIVNSSWLLVFSMFIFLSLALVKRYVELADENNAAGIANGRGYTPRDLGIITPLGTASGFLAALVLALYVNSQQVVILYAHPARLLLLCPLLLFWISRVWLLARRGEMHDDPVVFALKDGVSYLLGALMLLVIWLATGHGAGH